METQDRGYSLKRIFDAFGNSNTSHGRKVLEELVARVEQQRENEKWGKGTDCETALIAQIRLEEQAQEYYHAIFKGDPDVKYNAALNLMATAIRLINLEYSAA